MNFLTPKSDFTKAATYYARHTAYDQAQIKRAFRPHKISLINHWRKSQELRRDGITRTGIVALFTTALAVHHPPAAIALAAAAMSLSLYAGYRSHKKINQKVSADIARRLPDPEKYRAPPPLREPRDLHHDNYNHGGYYP